MVRLFEYCLTKTLMKHFYDDQNNFKAVFLCACSRASLIPINCILFLQCQQSELCANAMSQLFSSENQSFLQELNSWRRKGTPHFPALGLDTMKSFQTSRKSPVLIYWIHQARFKPCGFWAQHHRNKTKAVWQCRVHPNNRKKMTGLQEGEEYLTKM